MRLERPDVGGRVNGAGVRKTRDETKGFRLMDGCRYSLVTRYPDRRRLPIFDPQWNQSVLASLVMADIHSLLMPPDRISASGWIIFPFTRWITKLIFIQYEFEI
jgi:hypothetical protein